MSDETLFYVLGIALVCAALIVSGLGIRNERFPGSRGLLAGVAIAVAALVGATTVFAVRNAVDEEQHREAELASETGEAGPSAEQPPAGGQQQQGGGGGAKPGVKGPGGTVKLAADPTAIAYEEKRLSSKPGEVTVDLTNPSALQHDVVISKGAETLAHSDLISESETTVSAELAPGSYTFYCSVPGHREAGMEGILSVK
jgi:plastocyanin